MVPVIATSLVLGAHATGRLSPTGILSIRPAQFIGNISYAIYLWHWPLVILVPFVVATVDWKIKFLILGACVLFAWATQVLVETRFRRLINRFSLTTVFVATAIIMALVAGAGNALVRTANQHEAETMSKLDAALTDKESCLGVAALAEDADENQACADGQDLLLDPAAARQDKNDAIRRGCQISQPLAPPGKTCKFGNGKTQVALVGNSHSAHWLPALQELAEERNWTITTYIVTRCNMSTAPTAYASKKHRKDCTAYRKWMLHETTSGKYDAVVSSERQSDPVEGAGWRGTRKASLEGHEDFLKAWHEARVPVLVFRDIPFAKSEVLTCVEKHMDGKRLKDPLACSGPAKDRVKMDPLAEAVKHLDYDDQHLVQTKQWFCQDGICPPVIGRLVTTFDGSHISRSYAKTLVPVIRRELDQADIPGL